MFFFLSFSVKIQASTFNYENTKYSCDTDAVMEAAAMHCGTIGG